MRDGKREIQRGTHRQFARLKMASVRDAIMMAESPARMRHIDTLLQPASIFHSGKGAHTGYSTYTPKPIQVPALKLGKISQPGNWFDRCRVNKATKRTPRVNTSEDKYSARSDGAESPRFPGM